MHGNRYTKLNEAIAEAERFLKKARIAKSRFIEIANSRYKPYHVYEFSAVKRASLDLSNTLSKLRQAKVHD